jgi:hypothetical protein
MLAALGTLPFLATLWLLTVLGARVLEESGAKIAAALKGTTQPHPRPVQLRMRVRWQTRPTMRGELPLRAAA